MTTIERLPITNEEFGRAGADRLPVIQLDDETKAKEMHDHLLAYVEGREDKTFIAYFTEYDHALQKTFEQNLEDYVYVSFGDNPDAPSTYDGYFKINDSCVLTKKVIRYTPQNGSPEESGTICGFFYVAHKELAEF